MLSHEKMGHEFGFFVVCLPEKIQMVMYSKFVSKSNSFSYYFSRKFNVMSFKKGTSHALNLDSFAIEILLYVFSFGIKHW